MANTKSAKKAIKTTLRNRESNVARRSKIKTLIKKVSSLSKEQELAELQNVIYSELDKAPEQVLHPNKASRLKSQVAKAIQQKLKPDSK
ncbi:MAG: 30S ribosomal protein S20 [Candidatus Caenarcaniphilales bacterium]|nr:30S ribosomal protein S20 [Candidatus Caenarcaniphilales bacterium]